MLGSHTIRRALMSLAASVGMINMAMDLRKAAVQSAVKEMPYDYGYRHTRWPGRRQPAGTKLQRKAAEGTIGRARLK